MARVSIHPVSPQVIDKRRVPSDLRELRDLAARNTTVIAGVFGQKPKAKSRSFESLAAPCGPSSTHQPRMEEQS
jgi:hypothetical protein